MSQYGGEVTTIQGLASSNGATGEWHPVQKAFHERHALQCGYCTPGMIMAAVDLLRDVPEPSEEQVRQADYFGMASGRDADKLAVVGYTAVASTLVDAPLVEEMSLTLECRLLHTVEIGLHTQFIGEILDVKADEAVFDDAGNLDILKIAPLVFDTAGRGYHGVGPRLGSAFEIGKQLRK